MTPQNLIQFWAVATRPVAVNGLRLSVEKTGEEVARFEEMFRLVDEPQGVFRRWRQLVEDHAVKGKQVHDARLVAIMIESGIDSILTFNADDFHRYPDITVVDPRALAARGTPPGGSGGRRTHCPSCATRPPPTLSPFLTSLISRSGSGLPIPVKG